MRRYKPLLLMLFLFIAPVAASCLTSIEQDTLRIVANNTGVNPDIYINIFERQCNQAYLNETLSAFNHTVSTRMDVLNTQVQTTLNNSALVNTLLQISYLYNQSVHLNNNSIFVENRLNDFQSKIYSRMDNQSLDLLNQLNTFKETVNNQLVEKQTNSLSTNRIILIIIGILALGGGYWYYSRKRVNAHTNINHLPYEMSQLDNDRASNTYKNKGKSASKTE